MKGNIIGRIKEQSKLQDLYDSKMSEFLVVYGRRRTGKTFLVREYFDGDFSFYHTALSPFQMKDNESLLMQQQLKEFSKSLRQYGSPYRDVPEDWFDAFDRLKELLSTKSRKKRLVVFIDEMPWLDTPRSNFVTAFEHFWNNWGAGRHNLLLIVCGSASSWITNQILNNTGGLYGRTTYEIEIRPFSLSECELYYKKKNIVLDRYDQIQAYMILGGIPYYMSYLQKGMSLAQNIDEMFFSSGSKLNNEFERLCGSLFVDPQKYISVLKLLSTRRDGMTRKEISDGLKIPSGGGLTEILRSLEANNFIVSYPLYGEAPRNLRYKLIDLFTLFYMHFKVLHKADSATFWADNQRSPQLNSWRGFAFEEVCYVHRQQIKNALGIAGVNTNILPWRAKGDDGAQIDMVIDRDDRVVNICEIKFCTDFFTIDKDYDLRLNRKINTFMEQTKLQKNPHLTFITTYGLSKNEYSGHVQKCITADDLFSMHNS